MLIVLLFALMFQPEQTDRNQTMPSPDETILISFNEESPSYWSVVNDGVMGGLSSSRIRPSDNGHAVFEGSVSLENNGGFASVRTRASGPVDLSDFRGVSLRAKGDGKLYSLRIKTLENGRITSYAFEATFSSGTDWDSHQLSFEDFKPVFRGRSLSNVPPLNTSAIVEIGIMIKDGQEGSFSIELDYLAAFKGDEELKTSR